MANCIICGMSETNNVCKATVNSIKTGATGGFVVYESMNSSQVAEYERSGRLVDTAELLPRMARPGGRGIL